MLGKKLDLGQENMNRLFIVFVVPAVMSMLAMTTAGLVDSYFIGNFVGLEGIGAVTLVMPTLNISSAIITMIVSGGMVLAGIAAGEKEKERSNNIFNGDKRSPRKICSGLFNGIEYIYTIFYAPFLF